MKTCRPLDCELARSGRTASTRASYERCLHKFVAQLSRRASDVPSAAIIRELADNRRRRKGLNCQLRNVNPCATCRAPGPCPCAVKLGKPSGLFSRRARSRSRAPARCAASQEGSRPLGPRSNSRPRCRGVLFSQDFHGVRIEALSMYTVYGSIVSPFE